MAGGPIWSAQEDEFLRQNYRLHGQDWCAERLKRPVDATRNRAWKIGVSRPAEPPYMQSDMVDAAIRLAYTGDRKLGFRSRCAKRTGRSPSYVSQRALELGLIRRRDSKPWTDEERAFVEAHPLLPLRYLSRKMKAKGWHRTPRAISHLRSSGKIDVLPSGEFTAEGLAQAMGVSIATVTGWIKKGLLRAKPRGLNRQAQQGGDGYVIHEREVAAFIIHHAAHVTLAKLEPNKDWFIDLLIRCGRSRSTSNRQRAVKEAA